MPYDREQTRQILISAVDQFLDMLEREYQLGENDGRVDYSDFDVIAHGVGAEIEWTGEIDDEELTGSVPEFWFSNENRMFQRGFFETLLDSYKRH